VDRAHGAPRVVLRLGPVRVAVARVRALEYMDLEELMGTRWWDRLIKFRCIRCGQEYRDLQGLWDCIAKHAKTEGRLNVVIGGYP